MCSHEAVRVSQSGPYMKEDLMKPFLKVSHTLADAMTDVLTHCKRCEICELWATEARDLRDLRCLDGWLLINRMLEIRATSAK